MPYKMLNRWRDQHFRVITSLLVLEASQLYRDSGNKRPDRETRPTANGDSVYDAVGKNFLSNLSKSKVDAQPKFLSGAKRNFFKSPLSSKPRIQLKNRPLPFKILNKQKPPFSRHYF